MTEPNTDEPSAAELAEFLALLAEIPPEDRREVLEELHSFGGVAVC